jgi:hypothetical protein
MVGEDWVEKDEALAVWERSLHLEGLVSGGVEKNIVEMRLPDAGGEASAKIGKFGLTLLLRTDLFLS